MSSLGIVPAAGVGKRWGYYPKFLLPCGEREWLLDRAIRAMPCEHVAVVYSDSTETEIVRHLARRKLNDRVILLKNLHMDWDIYGSMHAANQVEADYYYFGMPDTYWPLDVFTRMGLPGISLGLHQTDNPERFGMLRNGTIVNKQLGQPGAAWGLLGWDREVRDLWNVTYLEGYTEAINLAMQECTWHSIPMDYYYDMASFNDYVNFIKLIS